MTTIKPTQFTAAIQTVILAGGLGTRLREETEFRPKPLVEVGHRPILWHIMKHYSVYKVREFIICLGYKGDKIREYFLQYGLMNVDFEVHIGTGNIRQLSANHDEDDWKVILAETGALTGTGGRIKRIEKYVQGQTFFATYGDSVADVPVDKLLEFHYQQGKIATLTVMRPFSRFGLLSVENYIVQEFKEKPQLETGWMNAGFFVFEPAIFDYLDDDCILEQETLLQLVADNQLAAYKHEGCHRCVDTYRDLKNLNEEWNSGSPAWKTW